MLVHYFPTRLGPGQYDGPSIEKSGPVIQVERRNREIAEHLKLHVLWLQVHIRGSGETCGYMPSVQLGAVRAKSGLAGVVKQTERKISRQPDASQITQRLCHTRGSYHRWRP
jgi:hypothetical protein